MLNLTILLRLFAQTSNVLLTLNRSCSCHDSFLSVFKTTVLFSGIFYSYISRCHFSEFSPLFEDFCCFPPMFDRLFTATEAPWRPAACVALRRTARRGGASGASSAWRRSHGNSSATWNSWTRALAIGWCWDGAGYHGIYGMINWWSLMVIDGYWWQCGIWDGYKLCSILVKYGLSENGNYHNIAPFFCGSLIRICGIHGMVIDAHVGWVCFEIVISIGDIMGWWMRIWSDMPESVIWNGRTTWGIESNKV